VTGTLIAPVIPSSAAGRPARAPAAARTLPLTASPVRPPALPRDVVYGLARVDRSGRVADRTVTGALGWRGGDRLTLTAEAGVVVIRRDPSGLVTPAAPVLRPDPRGAAAPLRAAPRRPGPAHRGPGRGHPDRVFARGGGSGPPRAHPVPGA
jgi:hypothetical protein